VTSDPPVGVRDVNVGLLALPEKEYHQSSGTSDPAVKPSMGCIKRQSGELWLEAGVVKNSSGGSLATSLVAEATAKCVVTLLGRPVPKCSIVSLLRDAGIKSLSNHSWLTSFASAGFQLNHCPPDVET